MREVRKLSLPPPASPPSPQPSSAAGGSGGATSDIQDGGYDAGSDKTVRLLRQAKEAMMSAPRVAAAASSRRSPNAGEPVWRAYVAVEHAILDLKLRYNLEHEPPPPLPAVTVRAIRRKQKQLEENSGQGTRLAAATAGAGNNNDDDDGYDSLVALARSKLDVINPEQEDKKALLYDLRVCRDLLKTLVRISQ